MNSASLSITIAIILSLVGCAHEIRTTTAKHSEKRNRLSEDEVTHCQQVAWDAVNSPAMLERFRPTRITQGPFEFSPEGMCCYLDKKTLDSVEVAVPSGGRLTPHACFVGVTVKRDNYEVVSMRERFWP